MSRNVSKSTSAGIHPPVQVSSGPSNQGSHNQQIKNKNLAILNSRQTSKANSHSRDHSEKMKLDSAGKIIIAVYIAIAT